MRHLDSVFPAVDSAANGNEETHRKAFIKIKGLTSKRTNRNRRQSSQTVRDKRDAEREMNGMA